ncbi:MAG: hypothetical protein M3P18_19765 [Actinomycetota bacterium]|nr:hypothetical protein [Actinomycetota bacterium]
MSGEESITVPESAIDLIADEILVFGQQNVETGGFVLAAREDSVVSKVALAGEAGIVRHRNLFQISERALDRLFTFADDHGMWIPAQFHSHRLAAFLSPTDKQHGLKVEGFTSVVVPTYAAPPRDITCWGWWRFEAGEWRDAELCRLVEGAVSVIRFDEDGARGA